MQETAVEKIVLFEEALRNFQDMPSSGQRLVSDPLALNYWNMSYRPFDRMLLKEAGGNFLSNPGLEWTHSRTLGYLPASCLPVRLLKIIRAIKPGAP